MIAAIRLKTLVGLVLALGMAPLATAQPLIAPGPSAPLGNPGGIGPGGIRIAPGGSGADIPMESIGPGGIRIAPGHAGRVSGTEIFTMPQVRQGPAYRMHRERRRIRR